MRRLTEASELYRGHLLPAFSVKGSEEFDDWLWEKREQLRELAVRNLRVLIGCHLEKGEYALGIDHAHSLVELDPLSEEAHRTLIHLYFLAGRRSQALMQYEAFAKRLETELDVTPLTETTALYESILKDTLPGPPTARRPDPIGPFVNMEGRDEDLDRLLRTWREVVQGKNRLVAIDGESGVGKSRLVKTFLHQVTSETRSLVLRGRSYTLSAHRVYGIVIDLLRNAWRVGRAEDRHRFHQLPLRQLSLVRELLPELSELETLDPSAPLGEIPERDELYEAVADFLLCAGGHPSGGSPNPLILFIDDAQWADTASLDLLTYLLESKRQMPLLAVLTTRPEDVGPEQIDALVALRRLRQAQSWTVERLDEASIERMVAALLEPEDRPDVTRFLTERSRGLPLLITETINYLCDVGHLMPTGSGRWRLVEPLGSVAKGVPTSIEGLIEQRVRQLPSSTRRLVAHAAIIGQRFDFHLLRQAADEHVLVVETAIGLMLEHWMARQFPDAWASTHRERDIVLWAQGARRGTFEFAHKEIRQSAHDLVPDDRRPLLHRRTAEAIEKTVDEGHDEHAEELAFHYLKAGALAEAVTYLNRSAQRAARLRADRTAHAYCVDAIDLAERLEMGAKTKADRAHWRRTARQLHTLREQVADRLGPEGLSLQPSLSITME
jgi:predicted ATPase